jgi:dipeptidyl aminopeptidase/acylaminoacyl peptidase
MSKKQLILWVLTCCTALGSSAFAQSPTGRFAAYSCYSYPTNDGYDYACAIAISNLADWLGIPRIDIPNATNPVWSPDGSKIAYQSDFGFSAVAGTFVLTLSDWSVVTLPDVASLPAWSPDSSKIAIQASEDRQLYVMSADGTISNRLTSGIQINPGRIAWSPDGRRIAFNCELDAGNRDICAIDATGTNLVRLTGGSRTAITIFR